MTIIRPLIEKDIPDAVALQAIPWPSEANAKLAENEMRGGLSQIPGVYGTNFVVAVAPENKIVGIGAWTIASFASNTYGLCWAVVHPDYRGKGINASMVDYRLEQIRRYNKGNLTVAAT